VQLTERKELMEYREEKLKKAAIGQAPADVSAKGQVLVRYQNQTDRTYNAAMRTVLALKADRKKHDDGDLDDPESEPEPEDAATTDQAPSGKHEAPSPEPQAPSPCP
jgi:hypothetical protein